MGATHGIAAVPGTNRPEEEGIFLLGHEDEIDWFAHMGLEQGHESLDVWEVTLSREPEFAEADSGYVFVRDPIPPEALRLHIEGWTSRDPGHVAGDVFHEIYFGGGDVSADLIAEDIVIVDIEGTRHKGRGGFADWALDRAHGAPPPPVPDSEGNVVMTMTGEGGYTIEGLENGCCLVSPPADQGFWSVVEVRDNRVVEIREFHTRSAALDEVSP